MVIENNSILYFSGTGNSFQVAKDLCNSLSGFNLLKISKLTNEEKIIAKSGWIGIVFPVYYSRLPLIVEKIAKKLEISKNVYVFTVATYSAAPSTVLKKLQNTLKTNNVILNSGFLIKMPKNHIYKYETKPVAVDSDMFEIEKKRVKEISTIINQRKNIKPEISKIAIDIAFDKLFIKATDKIFSGFHSLDTKFFTDSKCIGCKLCERICPVNNIEVKSKPLWKHNCERCMACIQYCPNKAIQIGKKRIHRYRNPNINVEELLSD